MGCTITDKEPLPQKPQRNVNIEKATSEIFGHILFHGKQPASKIIQMTGDPTCHKSRPHEYKDADIIINSNSTLSNIFVYIDEGVVTQNLQTPTQPVILAQEGCRYIPHISGIRVGQPLLILNNDNTLHNVYAASQQNKPFNIGMPRLVKKLTRTFQQQEVMIPFRCNVHPWMSAYVGVVDHPFFYVTNHTGAYKFTPIQSGNYTLVAWHERLGRIEKKVSLKNADTLQVHFDFNIN